MNALPAPVVRHLGLVDYTLCQDAMRQTVTRRDDASADEFWLLQHPQVITVGVGGDSAHVPADCEVPVVRSERGGQATCHGPGQLVVYAVLNLKRVQLGVRSLVATLEKSIQDLLDELGLAGRRQEGQPGVYVGAQKIASIGLRISRGHSSHGLALNVAPDLSLFRKFCVCGDPDLSVTSLHEHDLTLSVEQTAQRLLPHLLHRLYQDRMPA